jgi:hypothetical protein
LTTTNRRHIDFRYDTGVQMSVCLPTGLRWLRATATFVYIAALCVAVAVQGIAFIPGSPVTEVRHLAAMPTSPGGGIRGMRGRVR